MSPDKTELEVERSIERDIQFAIEQEHKYDVIQYDLLFDEEKE